MTPAPDLPAPGYACSLVADPHSVRDGLAQIVASPLLAGFGVDARCTVEIVLAEVLNNIAEHAYKGETGEIAVDLRLTGSGVLCLVIDEGVPMPDGSPPPGLLPTAGFQLEDLPEGGFGWHLIRTLTRDLSYTRLGRQNRLSFLIPAKWQHSGDCSKNIPARSWRRNNLPRPGPGAGFTLGFRQVPT